MNFPVSIISLVKDGSPELSQGQREKMAVFYKKHEGKFIQITIRKQGKPRSNNQLRYYFGILVKMIADETGHDTEDVHTFLKMKFLDRQMITIGTEEFMVAKSTTRLSTEEQEIYHEKIRAFAAEELSLHLPMPNEVPLE